MLLLGIDVGTSFIKISVVDAQLQKCIASAQYPEREAGINSQQPGWAEQSPEDWWKFVQNAILKINSSKLYDPKAIAAIGISYQMHGLVCVDKNKNVLRNAIIWCDSRAVNIGEQAFHAMGEENCLKHLLNSPGNFTASKLAWVKKYEPEIYMKIDKIMLPGDFIAMKMTGEITTTISALSEGIFWDFYNNSLSEEVMNYFGFEETLIPKIQPVFSSHGILSKRISDLFSFKAGIPVTYKAGDQPNNALSLNVLKPGEVAATAGTSGVIYAVSDELNFDLNSRINSFAHVNHSAHQKRIGVLLCINGTGILNRWIKDLSGNKNYSVLNKEASKIAAGSEGLFILPFGNGAERMLNNKIVGAHFENIDLNKHTTAHIYRAGQEAIAFAFRYGLDIMRENGINPTIVRAGKANMFLSEVFVESFVNAANVSVELFNADGSVGAALGAGIGAEIYKNESEAFSNSKALELVEPNNKNTYDGLYNEWKQILQTHLNAE